MLNPNFKSKLWVDDLRIPPDDSYDIARTFNDAILSLMANEYEEIYLDHDLACWDADGKEKTGYGIVLWLAEQVHTVPDFVAPMRYYMLTDNSVGRKNMAGVIERYLGRVEPWIKPNNLRSLNI